MNKCGVEILYADAGVDSDDQQVGDESPPAEPDGGKWLREAQGVRREGSVSFSGNSPARELVRSTRLQPKQRHRDSSPHAG